MTDQPSGGQPEGTESNETTTSPNDFQWPSQDASTPATNRKRPATWIVVLAVAAIVIGVVVIVVALVASSGSDGKERAAAADDFAVDSGALATTPDGATWSVVAPGFVVRNGAAQVNVPPGGSDSNAIASLDLGRAVTSIRVEMDAASEGAGLVFRYADSDNYWSLVAAPRFGTWNLAKRVDGESKFVTNTGLGFSAGPVTVEVKQDGSSITVVIAGKQQATVADAALLDATGAGIIGRGSDTSSRWTSVAVLSAD